MLGSLSACGPEEELGVREDIFGSIHMEVHRAANLPSSPFVTTEDVNVTANVTLGQCLTDFYDRHEEWAPDGEKGSVVAEAWLEHLCDRKVFPDVFRCTALEHVWMPGAGAGGRHRLSVRFHADHADLENFDIRVGPLARANLSDCEEPTVEVGLDGAEGYAGEELVWHIDPESQQNAWEGATKITQTDAADPVKIFIARADQ